MQSNNANKRDANERSRAPPPVVNKRFEQLADEERGKQNQTEREPRRAPPPPLVTNSRFAAAAEADKDYNRDRDDNRMQDRGPPPVANSRFAAAAEADRDYNRDRNENRMDDRGPPPVANSRFAAAAEADRDYNRDRNDNKMEDLGPPPVANSRFAAAAEADRDYNRDRDDNNNRMDDRGPPPVANSRFMNAVAADQDYHDEKNARNERDNNRQNDDRYDDRYDDQRGNGGGGRYDGGGGRYDEQPRPQSYDEPQKSSVADLLKPKARPMEENILKVPTKDHSDNFLKAPSKVKPKPVAEKSKSAPSAPTPVKVVDDSDILAEFASGNKLGTDLQAWVESLPVVPSVERLVFHLLTETEKSTPDLECGWAESTKYGAALVSLVEDDLLKQKEILFAVQKYSQSLGMPKLDDEYVVQAMFRAMYKFDLADDETFTLWKEDESPEHEAGKLKAVIQTVDWFNWLEEEDDDEEDYEEEEE